MVTSVDNPQPPQVRGRLAAGGSVQQSKYVAGSLPCAPLSELLCMFSLQLAELLQL